MPRTMRAKRPKASRGEPLITSRELRLADKHSIRILPPGSRIRITDMRRPPSSPQGRWIIEVQPIGSKKMYLALLDAVQGATKR